MMLSIGLLDTVPLTQSIRWFSIHSLPVEISPLFADKNFSIFTILVANPLAPWPSFAFVPYGSL